MNLAHHSPPATPRPSPVRRLAEGRRGVPGAWLILALVALGLGALAGPVRGQQNPGNPDTGFNASVNGPVRSVITQADGKILIGGDFTLVNGASRDRLARLNADGTLDNGFLAGVNGRVSALAVQPDGKLIVGGEFLRVNGQALRGIARLNADGTLDAGFGANAGNTVYAVARQPDGRIVLAGQFAQVNGVARDQIARLNADGSLDAGFVASTVGGGPIFTVALQADGKVLAGGTSIQALGSPRVYFARFNADSILDADFAGYVNDYVYSLAVQADGKILVGGQFLTVDGQARPFLARLNAAAPPAPATPGSVSPGFDPGAGTDSTVRAIVYQPDGRALIGGAFTSYRGVSRNGVARVNPDGSLDASFDPGSGADDTVNALLLLPNGQVLVGGDFSSFNGIPRNGVVRLNADGRVDPAFDAGLEAGGLAVPAGAHPWAPAIKPEQMAHAKGTNRPGFLAGLALDGQGRPVLAGLFQRIRGKAAPAVVRLQAANGGDGTPDPGFSVEGAPNGAVRAVAYTKDKQKLLLASLFDRTGSVNRKNVARLNADGTPDPAFNPGAGAEGGAVNALLVQDDDTVVLGGEFIRAGGQPRARLARVNRDGSLDGGFDPGAGADGAVRALAPAPNKGVLVGGDFQNFDGSLAAFFSRVKSDGKKDRDFNVGNGANGAVAAIALAPASGAALVGGDFTRVADSTRNRLALVDNSAAGVSVVGAPAQGGFLVSRVGSLDPITVLYHNGGSAVRGVDYEAFSGRLNFDAGQGEAVIPVRLLPGANRNKKVKVFLDPAPNGEYAIGKAQSKVFLSDLP